MKIRNKRLWRSDSARSNEDSNTSPIASKEQSDRHQNPEIKKTTSFTVTKATWNITFHKHKQKQKNGLKNLFSLKHAKNHEGKYSTNEFRL
jgi:16S rRNA U1498 N3-methylase RsmE